MRGLCILLSGIMLIAFMAGCKKAKGPEPAAPAVSVGATCETDADCGDGKCVDLNAFDDGCTGKVCTVTCTSDEDCPTVFKEPDCESMEGVGSVCLYGEWEEQYCK